MGRCGPSQVAPLFISHRVRTIGVTGLSRSGQMKEARARTAGSSLPRFSPRVSPSTPWDSAGSWSADLRRMKLSRPPVPDHVSRIHTLSLTATTHPDTRSLSPQIPALPLSQLTPQPNHPRRPLGSTEQRRVGLQLSNFPTSFGPAISTQTLGACTVPVSKKRRTHTGLACLTKELPRPLLPTLVCPPPSLSATR